MCVTVVLPAVPATAMESVSLMSCASISARLSTRTPIARAASSSGERLMAPL
jgi:hypothetical protein